MKNLENLSETDFSYIAGILERCSFTIYSHGGKKVSSYAPRITMAFNDNILVEWLVKNVGGSNNPNNRGGPQWVIRGSYATELLKRCMPYLKTKRRQANIFLLFGLTIKKMPPRGLDGSYIRYTSQEKLYRERLVQDLREVNLETPYIKAKNRTIFDELPPAIQGLFDFIPDIDGFGETLSPRSGFFDAFIAQLEEYTP